MIAAGHRARGLGVPSWQGSPHEYRIRLEEAMAERAYVCVPSTGRVCLSHVHAPVWANVGEKCVR